MDRLATGPYTLHSTRPQVDRKVILTVCESFAKQVKVAYPKDYTADSQPTNPLSGDLAAATQRAHADDQYQDMKDTGFINYAADTEV